MLNTAITWVQISIFALCTPYAITVLVLFTTKIKQPSIRERFPILVLITGIGNSPLNDSLSFSNNP